MSSTMQKYFVLMLATIVLSSASLAQENSGPPSMRDMDTEERRAAYEALSEEDKEIVARVQDGASFGSSEPGYLHSALEVYVKEFRLYLDRMLAD